MAISTLPPPRTYNQTHISRSYSPTKRRISIYWTWSYPWEAQRDPPELDNRFSTMTEVRLALWPAYETPEWSAEDCADFGALSTLHAQLPTNCWRDYGSAGRGFPTCGPSRIQTADRRTHPCRRGYAPGVRPRSYSVRTRAGSGGNCRDWRMAQARGHLPLSGAPPRRRLHR